jgi:lipoprotein NlpI
MVRVLPAFVLLLAVSGARAAGYDDFSRGISASNRLADDEAISLFSSALTAGDLNASLQPVAYLDRGRVYLRKKECDLALADFSAALKLKPDSGDALEGRAKAHVCLGNLRAAADDIGAGIKITPTASAYSARARVRYLLRDFAGATNDLEEALKLEPEFPYHAIWLGLAQLRAATFDAGHFSHVISDMDDRDWPYPILSLLKGDRTPESVMRDATREDDKGRKCEADFYLAEWHLISQSQEAARPLLQEASTICPRDYVELEAARVELGQLH